MASESKRTVLLAFAVNLVIAIAKTAAGLLTLSSAMLAEAAHSWADTTNRVFLLFALKRSRRPADTTHPFGYGKERYFWSLLAAVGIFVTGASSKPGSLESSQAWSPRRRSMAAMKSVC